VDTNAPASDGNDLDTKKSIEQTIQKNQEAIEGQIASEAKDVTNGMISVA
jgi:hypothetical protein